MPFDSRENARSGQARSAPSHYVSAVDRPWGAFKNGLMRDLRLATPSNCSRGLGFLLACMTLVHQSASPAANQAGPPSRPDQARVGEAGPAGSRPVDFSYEIRPLLSDRCFRCHGPDAGKRKAKLRLDTRAGMLKKLEEVGEGWAVVKPRDPDKSELIRRIFTDDEDDRMPPPESHLTLSAADKAMLKRWVVEGADYRPHWSLGPVQPVGVPRLRDGTAPANPIDAFVRTRLEEKGLTPAPRASPEVIIRRLALNLTGLPPAPADIDAFLADRSPGADVRAIERYLASPAYGERMAMDWLDLARYADTYGYQADVDRDMSAYRDWVIRAFNDNLPYDQFLTWQIAGDLLPNPTREQRIATAFNRLHRQTNEGGSIEEEFRTEYVVDRVNTFGTAMLGLTMECARCHDHKFDAITQRDYFSMFAFFNSIDESGLYSHFTNATPSPSLLLWAPEKETQHDLVKTRIAAAEVRLEAVSRSARQAFNSWLETAPVFASGRGLAGSKTRDLPGLKTRDYKTGQAAPASPGLKTRDYKTGQAAAGSPGLKTGSPGLKTRAYTVNRPAPIAHLEFNAVAGETTPDSVSTVSAQLQDGPALVHEGPAAGGSTAALRFSGDNQVVHPGVRPFSRTDPFSLSLRLKPTVKQARGIILHQSRAWSDAGSRGFELTLDHGRPFFGLIHFWPGNAVAVRAKRSLPLNKWSRLVVTYDGSSRAAGIRLYLDGRLLPTEVVRDRLYKDIGYGPATGDRSSEKHPFTIGARFRDSGFKDGLIDDLQVFDTRLTAAEVVSAVRRDPRDPAAFEHFLVRQHQPYISALAELKRLREEENTLISDTPEIMVMEEMRQPRPAHLLKRGAYDAPAAIVPRDTPGSLPPFPKNQPRNRLGLARWLTDRTHPLAARVVVNRIWRMHFGRGLVATQEDFGSQGKLPSHPELLDWLAGRFMDEGWDVKALHRLIVTSDTFQQSSQAAGASARRDPDNELLARGPKTRLMAEQIRDSALAASGLLNRTIGGPSVKPYQPAGLWEQSGTGKTYKQDTGDALYRRSLYTFWRRTSPPPSMITFDAMSREVCTAKRDVTATPLQSLVLLNDPQFVEAARVLAERVLKRFPNDEAGRNRDVFRALIGRLPDETEEGILARLFAGQRDLFARNLDDAAKLLGVGESKSDEALSRADLAAMTTVVNAIMNFDEFVVVR
jgi:hypothetical protein